LKYFDVRGRFFRLHVDVKAFGNTAQDLQLDVDFAFSAAVFDPQLDFRFLANEFLLLPLLPLFRCADGDGAGVLHRAQSSSFSARHRVDGAFGRHCRNAGSQIHVEDDLAIGRSFLLLFLLYAVDGRNFLAVTRRHRLPWT